MAEHDGFLLAIAAASHGCPAAKSALCDRLTEGGVDAAGLLVLLDRIAEGVLLPYENPDPRFAATEFVVVASDEERQLLWERHSPESLFQVAGRRYDQYRPRTVSWQQDSHGLVIQIGAIWDRPVNLSCVWARLNGHLVLFCHPCSQLADYRLVERWLDKHCSLRWDNGTRLARCDAMNFHHCLQHCEAT